MFYPFQSTVVAIIIYLLIIIAVGFNIKNNAPQPLISLEIDAEMIGAKAINGFNQHQHNSRLKENHKEINKIDDSKNTKIKHQHLDNQPHSTNEKNAPSSIKSEAQKTKILFQPLPEIPEDLRYEDFSTQITAKFYIDKDGLVSNVELINYSTNPRLNSLLIKSLYRWRFEKSSTANTQIINVKFAVN